ncbi:MAG: hypothetical protein ACPL88_08260, partial [Bryobacteraceae bacterium]
LGLIAVLMSEPEGCFAVAMPHHDEPYHSLYLGLFGHTVRAGETARARDALAVLGASELPRVPAIYAWWLRRDGPGQ